MPPPGIGTHVGQVASSLPSKQLAGLYCIRIATRHIPYAAITKLVWDPLPTGSLKGLDDLEHAVPAPRPQVDGGAVRLRQALERAQVALGEVDHVDVVAHASAVGRGVVAAPDAQALAPAGGDLGDEGHEVVGDALRVFADQAAGVGADGVEIAQQCDAPVGLGPVEVAQHVLDHQLAAAVGIGGRERMLLGQRQELGLTIDGGRRAEDQGLDAGGAHGLQQAQAADDVVVVVVERLLRRFADGLEAGKVDDGAAAVRAQHGLDGWLVAHVATHHGQRLAGDALHALQRLGVAVAEVVEDDDVVAGLQQFDAGV